MARGRDYKAEYAKRIAAAKAKGKTRQQARGHRAREHVIRAERERQEFGLSGQEVRAIIAWCDRYKNEARDTDEVISEAASNGYAWFTQYRDVWNAARRQYLREQASGTYSTRGLGYLEYLTAQAVATDIAWLYYH